MRGTPDSYRDALREAAKKHPDLNRIRVLLEQALKAENPEAAYALGTWYLHGHGVKRSVRRALALLRQAAKGNVPNALFDLAVCYEKGEGTAVSARRAFECYVGAALRGDQQSVYEVGRCLYYGIGIARSARLAWIWLDRAKELGVSEVQMGEFGTSTGRKAAIAGNLRKPKNIRSRLPAPRARMT